MSTPQYDPKGLEAAVEAAYPLYWPGDSDHSCLEIVEAALTAYFEEIEPVLRQWAEGLAREAYVQGFIEGQDRGRRDITERGQSARVVTERLIQQNEYPYAPIAGHEMDGWPLYPGATEEVKSDG